MVKSGRVTKWLLTVFVGAVAIYLLLPLLMIAFTSIGSGSASKFPPQGFTLEWYANLKEQTQFLDAFKNSLIASAGAVILALVTGTLAAVAIVQYPFPGAGLLRAFFVSPMVMPKITLGIAYLILFSKMHIAGGLFGLVLGEAVIVLPFVLTIVGSALANLKPVHREAAADLGASPWRIFLPLRCLSSNSPCCCPDQSPLYLHLIRSKLHCCFFVRTAIHCRFSYSSIWRSGRIQRSQPFRLY
ncbi:hypothetical protein N6H13_30185 [Paenibacillus sp. CC-CFT742]|nr:hypothetical protein [Paenibacillus sp. CC-CFT742]WJH29102.1 hypothetical protein N6H13_30185 [Paenibacillus sp. CC-CFT742]